jgi:glycosyltransferase involved in cell wall biosynthesis
MAHDGPDTVCSMRVLQSFPHKIGSGRIADTAWYQAEGVAAAGAELTLFPGVVHKGLPEGIAVRPTLAQGRWRLPYSVFGRVRTLELHDRIVARRLERLAGRVDIVHLWPLAARHTARVARRLGIPTVLERPNAHTRFAYEVVREECERLGVDLPADHEHAYNELHLQIEEEEYRLADRLLCPSDFVRQTFLDEGFAEERLVRHMYGYDPRVFHPGPRSDDPGRPFTLLFVGVAAVRKGVHFALEAWLASPASTRGRLLIAGEFLPAYEERLRPLLAHDSVEVLGHRTDVAELMRTSDAFVLPSIEEGSALVTAEAIASGCVPLVSDATSGVCFHDVNSLVHPARDVATLSQHITAVYESRELLSRLRAGCEATAPEITWGRCGVRLLDAYRSVVEDFSRPAAARASALVEA